MVSIASRVTLFKSVNLSLMQVTVDKCSASNLEKPVVNN